MIGQQLAVVGRITEQELRRLGSLEVQVRFVLPSEADAAVDLNVGCRRVEVRLGAVAGWQLTAKTTCLLRRHSRSRTAAAAKHLTPTTLELGGKSPAYVHASADLDVAARRIAWGKFLNAGQTCIAPDYVLADHSIQEPLIERLAAAITAFYGHDPRASPSYGRIVNARHLERLHGLLDRAGTVVVGGQFDAADRYFAPTVTVDPEPNSQILQEEIFGPILPVLAVDGPDQAAAYISGRPKPLAMYVFAEDGAVVEELISATSSGGVCVNHTIMHLRHPTSPFGGVGDSGMGAYHGKAGFDTFSHHRSVLTKPSKPDPRLLYPPYKPLTERIIRWVAR